MSDTTEQTPQPEQPAFRPRSAPAAPDPLLVAMLVRLQRDLLHETAERLHEKSATLRTIAHLWYSIAGLSLLLMVSLLLDLLP